MPLRFCIECGRTFPLTSGRGSARCPACRQRHDRQRGTTTQRGYDGRHKQARAKLIKAWHPGDPCAHCGKPMAGPASSLDLAHTADRTGYRGLAHAECNRGNR